MLGLTLLRNQIRTLRFVNSYRRIHNTATRPSLTYCTSHYGNILSKQNRENGNLLPGTNHMTNHVTHHVRSYAKKAKDKKGKAGKKAEKMKLSLTEEEMTEVVDLHQLNQEMSSMVGALQQDLVQKFSLRTSAATFENMTIETPEGDFPLIQIAQIIQKNPTLIFIDTSRFAHYAKYIKPALMNSGLNLNPQQEGGAFFVPLPKVTRERREELAKGAKALCGKTKEKLKSIQTKYLREVGKQSEDVSYDLKHHVQEYIMLATKTFSAQAETVTEAKQKELLGNQS